MKLLVALIAWCILLAVAWPLAIVVLVLFPILWLLAIRVLCPLPLKPPWKRHRPL